jgi:hypothetical protein
LDSFLNSEEFKSAFKRREKTEEKERKKNEDKNKKTKSNNNSLEKGLQKSFLSNIAPNYKENQFVSFSFFTFNRKMSYLLLYLSLPVSNNK